MISNSIDVLMDEQECIEYFKQICRSVKSVHMTKIIHRDIKSKNILYSKYNGNKYPFHLLLTLTDFGISNFMIDAKAKDAGTLGTMAPEIKKER